MSRPPRREKPVHNVVFTVVPLLGASLADKLSMAAVFPALVEMERNHGSFARAVFERRRTGNRMPEQRLFSRCDGVGALPRALAAALGAGLHTRITVRRHGQGAAACEAEMPTPSRAVVAG